jgi:hypothetical protein
VHEFGEMLADEFGGLPSQLGDGVVQVDEAAVAVEDVDDVRYDAEQVHVAAFGPDDAGILPVQAFPDGGGLPDEQGNVLDPGMVWIADDESARLVDRVAG